MASNTPITFNGNFGSPYLTDGFWHDTPYGRGTQEHDPDVFTTSGYTMTELPGELTASEEVGDDLGDLASVFLNELGSGADDMLKLSSGLETPLLTSEGVVDHHWLSDAQQDPTRLPEQRDIVTQLQNLWGDRTDGIFRVPATDLIPTTIKEEEVVVRDEEQNEDAAEDLYEGLIKSAARTVASGRSLHETFKPQAGRSLWAKLRPHLLPLEEERGLLGPVYLYASSYPRLHRGKWSKTFTKHLKRAKYLIADSRDDVQGLEEFFPGLKVVDSTKNIPWRGLCARTLGVPKPSTSKEAKDLLRQHYLAPQKRPSFEIQASRPKVTMPVDTVSHEEARQRLAEYQPPTLPTRTKEEALFERAQKRAFKILAGWVRAGALPQDAGRRFAQVAKKNPREAVQKAASQLLRVHQGHYHGEGERRFKDASVSTEAALEAVRQAARIRKASWERAKVSQKRANLAVLKVCRMLHAGLQGEALDSEIRSKIPRPILADAADNVKRLRKAHEGLAGNLYVIASLYASPRGVTGCDQGAKIHRSDGARYVLAMKRCQTCTLRNASDQCTKYKKPLLWDVPADMRKMARKARTKKASAAPAPATSPIGEFGLESTFEVEVKDVQKHKDVDISFEGGWQW